ncbi:MAG: LutB/LldF family L-lactate oxidation iron-sulfur protein [Bryobacteraceae bacterium]
MNSTPLVQIREALENAPLQAAIYTATGRLMEKRRNGIGSARDEFETWREQAHRIKRHTLENLDHYLEQLEAKLTRHGGQVVYARDESDAVEFLLKLAAGKQAGLVVKSKSMTTEEIDLRGHFERRGIEMVETDLGEYIIQLARERPYHIVAPALHMTRHQVADLFQEKLGVAREEIIEKQTMIARAVLRQKFLNADIGITGANFLVADSGAVVVVENEGNARLSSSAPRIQVAVAGIEKLIPRAQDLPVFLKVLGRSATGQPMTVYTSFLSGPRREGEIDGPEEFYLLLLDNGRTRLLADREKRQSLYCIRCGACLNHCPVYRKIGGHNYPWIYSGPIGAIITPQFHGVSEDPWLPYASSLCGACAEVCPVKIDIPHILLDLREEVTRARRREGVDRLERLAFRLWAWVMRRPKVYEWMQLLAGAVLPESKDRKWIRRLAIQFGPLKAWLGERDLPPAPAKTFRQMWRARQAARRTAS